jgi:hypothetical protein
MDGWRWRLLFGAGLSLARSELVTKARCISGLEPHFYFWHSSQKSGHELRASLHFFVDLTYSFAL